MKSPPWLLVIVSLSADLLLSTVAIAPRSVREDPDRHHGHDGSDAEAVAYSNRWIVHLEDANDESASVLANSMGCQLVGALGPEFPEMYVMEKSDHDPERDVIDGERQTRALRSHVRVVFAQQLFHKLREKRVGSPRGGMRRDHRARSAATLMGGMRRVHRARSSGLDGGPSQYRFQDRILDAIDPDQPMDKQDNLLNDPQWNDQWYMNPDSPRRSPQTSNDLNVVPVWRSGITGRGVNVTILDDGIEYTHDDLKDNFALENSRNFLSKDLRGDTDVLPKTLVEHHGTRCAGEVVMAANNSKCGAGVAFNANVGMVRMLGGVLTDQVEGQSLVYALDRVQIYSASWGPTDNGATLEGPGYLARQALLKGVTEGRGGLGAIYVWAAGNGAKNGDNCNCDGYTSSIYTLSVSSVTEHEQKPWYSEVCASTLTATYSSGDQTEKQVATTDVNNECTLGHTGTSASAPLAAGVIALVLEANPQLSWRDVQHLVVRTSQFLPSLPGWRRNGAGLEFNPMVGFGMIDSNEMVKAAKALSAPSVGLQIIQKVSSDAELDRSVLLKNAVYEISFTATDDDIRYLEHVEVVGSIGLWKRGCLEAFITSPSGTVSKVMEIRDEDKGRDFAKWPFMSVHFWGENPAGQWRFQITDGCTEVADDRSLEPAVLGDHFLVLYGTEEEPQIAKMLKPIRHNLDNVETRVRSSRETLSTNQLEIDSRKILSNAKSWDDLIGQNILIRENNLW